MNVTPNPLKSLKFIPKLWGTLVYFIFLVFGMVLFMARSFESLRFDFLMGLFPNYHTHISNFSISLFLVLIVGFMGGIQAKSIKGAYLAAGLLIVTNLVYEAFLPIINTKDMIDAYFGIVGSLVPFVFLIPYQKYGIIKNPNYIEHNKRENPVL